MRGSRSLTWILPIFVLFSGCSVTLAGITALDEARAAREARVGLDELEELDAGRSVRLYLDGGTTVTGSLRRVSASELLIMTEDDESIAIPCSDVRRVERMRQRYSIVPPLVFGGVVDAGFLILLATIDIGPNVQLNW